MKPEDNYYERLSAIETERDDAKSQVCRMRAQLSEIQQAIRLAFGLEMEVLTDAIPRLGEELQALRREKYRHGLTRESKRIPVRGAVKGKGKRNASSHRPKHR